MDSVARPHEQVVKQVHLALVVGNQIRLACAWASDAEGGLRPG